MSAIIGEEVLELDFLPQESTIRLEWYPLTVYRLDFSAKIRQSDGALKQVIIEIQKAKLAADIMRFRRYLGAQYQKKEHAYTVVVDGKEQKRAMPIVSIYFLGYQLEHTTAPVIKVARKYYDVTTGEEIHTREEFIESLTHDSFVIQIPYLHHEHKTELEQLLSVFDQRYVVSNGHVLNITEAGISPKYQRILRRLQAAMADPIVQSTMDGEDDLIEELKSHERAIAQRDELIEAQDKTIKEKDKTIEEKDKVLEEQKRQIEELRARLNITE